MRTVDTERRTPHDAGGAIGHGPGAHGLAAGLGGYEAGADRVHQDVGAAKRGGKLDRVRILGGLGQRIARKVVRCSMSGSIR